VLAVPGLHDVLARLEGVAPGWIALAIVLELDSCAGFVVAFRHVFARVPGRLATRVALTQLAFTAVVPAGRADGTPPALIGTAAYLRLQAEPVAAAAS
jgi:hypothetical protein